LEQASPFDTPQVEERAGLAKAGIANLEQGRTSPAWATVIALCKAFGVTPGAFTQAPATRPDAKPGRPHKASVQAGMTAEKKSRAPARKQKGK
jgi:transcriptional regulator with XRE-family HTH domain